MLGGLVFWEMLSQYPQSAFQGSPRVAQGGQQQFSSQTLRVQPWDPRRLNWNFPKFRKIRAPIKIKSALPPPPQTPPKKRGILRTSFFLQKERIFPGVHKIGAPISGPRIADTNFTDTRIFLKSRSFVAVVVSWAV